MSGSIFSNAAGAIGGAFSAAAGSLGTFSPLAPPITIGGVPLTDFQVPRHLPIGGEQRLKVHDIPGGQQAIQGLGDFPEDILIEGIFQGPTQLTDAQAFVALLRGGTPVPLIGLGVSLNVIVRAFRRNFESGWIRYNLVLKVVPDVPADQPASGNAALQQSVSADASTAGTALSTNADVFSGATAEATGNGALAGTTGAEGSIGLPGEVGATGGDAFAGIQASAEGVPPALATAQSGTSSVAAFTAPVGALVSNEAVVGTFAAMPAIQGPLEEARGLLEGGINGVNTLFSGNWSPAVSIATQAAAALRFGLGSAGMLAGVMSASGFVGRIAGNLINAAPNASASPAPPAPGQVATS